MKVFWHSFCLICLILVISNRINASGHELDFLINQRPIPLNEKHVHLMHIDGAHAEIFDKMLKRGRLPHFSFLLSRGKHTFEATTVDKSETMKVILSYLTSRIDTEIVGWWQFSRQKFSFTNTFTHPTGVLNYALGLGYPKYPTLFDFLTYQGHPVSSGFALHRRNVHFAHYGRNYDDGLNGVFYHQYFNQAHESMKELTKIYEHMVIDEQQIPRLTHSLLAAADEYAHLYGISTNNIKAPNSLSKWTQYCFEYEKKSTTSKTNLFFDFLNKNEDYRQTNTIFINTTTGHFQKMETSFFSNKAKKLCMDLPTIITNGKKRVAHPYYILGLTLIDIELGHLINTLRSIRFDRSAQEPKIYLDRTKANGILSYVEKREVEDSLFEKTLFVFTGDHGMVDSKKQMSKMTDPKEMKEVQRHSKSINASLISYLNEHLDLDTVRPSDPMLKNDQLIGMDDTFLPGEIQYPFNDFRWQNSEIKSNVLKTKKKAQNLFDRFVNKLKSRLGQKYWWTFILKPIFIYPKFEKEIGKYKDFLVNLITSYILQSDEQYMRAQKGHLEKYFSQHVRLVYGGGARNNAELFIPTPNAVWTRRPTLSEILDFKPNNGKNLIAVLKEVPSVDLFFIRMNNEDFIADNTELPLSDEMKILVFNKKGHKGIIKVEKDSHTKEILYSYKRLTTEDPLNIEVSNTENWITKNYHQWIQHDLDQHGSSKLKNRYHNAVAGMGSYLYSRNPSIGDIVLTAAEGWNFGGNSAGHGGLWKNEKLTTMMVSGPQIKPGFLYTDNGTEITSPSVLDIAPTILNWLGYEDEALTKFARSGDFEKHWEHWNRRQNQEILEHLDYLNGIKDFVAQQGLDLDVTDFKSEFKELLEYLPSDLPRILPDYNDSKEQGKKMILFTE